MNKLIKKVLSIFVKVLFKQEKIKNTNCINCNNKLIGNQRRFCCDNCNNEYWRNKYRAKKQSKKKIKNLILMKGGLKNE